MVMGPLPTGTKALVLGRNVPDFPHCTAHQVPGSQQAPVAKADPFYGHESIAWMCARFITHLFACPEYLPSRHPLPGQAPPFHRLCPPSHQAPLRHHLRRPHPPPALDGSFSDRTGII
ncbi:hypothetical protein NMY22_g17561 [Coprinellus aureogranulatus]|nr:hypothetical protein NMY22_g17561 [Coprinellus aureogranulatus]